MKHTLATEYEISESDMEVLSSVQLSVLNLPVRIYNSLRRHGGLRTVSDLFSLSNDFILVIRGIGKKSIKQIHSKLASFMDSYPKNLESLLPPEEYEGKLVFENNQCFRQEKNYANRSWIPIDELDLSLRTYNCLMRAEINAIADLVTKTDDELLRVRNLGKKTLKEIKNKLEGFDQEDFNMQDVSGEKTNLPDWCNNDEFIHKVMYGPFEKISTSRLGLPYFQNQRLNNLGIDNLQQLTKRDMDQVIDDWIIRKHLDEYIRWFSTVNKDVWKEEINNEGLSPISRMKLAKNSLAEIIEQWLSLSERLDDRDRQVIRCRYGLYSKKLTLKDVGEQLGVTRERVRQIQARSMKILMQPRYILVVQPILELMFHLLKQAGGLINEKQLEEKLNNQYNVGNIEPIDLAHLIFESNNNVKWIQETGAWGLSSLPLSLVPGIQAKFEEILEDKYVPLPRDELISQYKSTQLYLNYQGMVEDNFLIKCLNIHPKVCFDKDGNCGLSCWENQRLNTIIQTMREIGEPVHYTDIAKKTNMELGSVNNTSARNIHAQLQRNTDIFVRVGHGIYGLSEWGLHDDGSIANAAYRVLSDAGRPLHCDIITEQVLETWQVNPRSVLAALQREDRFVNIGQGVYWLREKITKNANVREDNFSDLFHKRLDKFQNDLNLEEGGLGYDTHAEADAIRQLGMDFFK